MKTLAIIAASFALATAAQAVTVTTAPGAPDPGFPGQTLVVSFDAPNAIGYNWTAGVINIATGNITGAAAPALTAAGTRYGFVSNAIAPKFATLSTPNLSAISFYWGSIDPGNSVDVLGTSGILRTVVGNQLPAFSGNQTLPNTNRRVFFTAGPGERITGLTFRASNVAFEFDSIAATVPEPSQWALLLVGFGLVGAAARRRNRTVVAA